MAHELGCQGICKIWCMRMVDGPRSACRFGGFLSGRLTCLLPFLHSIYDLQLWTATAAAWQLRARLRNHVALCAAAAVISYNPCRTLSFKMSKIPTPRGHRGPYCVAESDLRYRLQKPQANREGGPFIHLLDNDSVRQLCLPPFAFFATAPGGFQDLEPPTPASAPRPNKCTGATRPAITRVDPRHRQRAAMPPHAMPVSSPATISIELPR